MQFKPETKAIVFMRDLKSLKIAELGHFKFKDISLSPYLKRKKVEEINGELDIIDYIINVLIKNK